MRLRKENILIVDDDLHILELLQRHLHSWNYHHHTRHIHLWMHYCRLRRHNHHMGILGLHNLKIGLNQVV